MGKVISFERHRREAALERLNRLTGLGFERLPESLLPHSPGQGRDEAASTRLRSWK